ncbi:hypothetical protein L6164_000976 [Bauhinia variegata]|uniref:Uncharacterized protein n=1 Tax=Bauhinia variegata TaxID=167791 RepID=A0ACB9Q865_BAUVA|nr:hypothetical protein L6164_000976 [Bauhinia variegata]
MKNAVAPPSVVALNAPTHFPIKLTASNYPVWRKQSEGVFNIGVQLTETNYDVWSQLMEMHIAEREKLSYIMGKTNPPDESDKAYDKW